MQDVLIIGGGVIGLCAAIELVDRGATVTVLDAGDAIPSASWAGGGILSPLFPWRAPAPVTALADGAMDRYRRLGERFAEAGIEPPEIYDGGLLIEKPEDDDRAIRWSAEQGLTVESVDARRVQPGLSFQSALYYPELGSVRNPGLLAGLRDLLLRLGGRFHDGPASLLEERGGSWLVKSGDAELEASRVVVAAGKSSPGLLESLGLRLAVFPVKGEMIMYRAQPELLRTIVLTEKSYLIPRRDGRILAGSTLEPGIDSVVPSRHAGEWLHGRALELMPDLRGCPIEAQWAGVRPGTRDEVPVIGAVPGHAGLWLATGHYRNGLVSAPATGELLAGMMNRESLPLDPAPFDPVRLLG